MKTVKQIHDVVQGVPYMTIDMAEWFTDLIVTNKLKDIVELGHFHGVSTCYLAAAAARVGGRVDTIDIVLPSKRTPDISELLAKCGLNNVSIHLERKNVGGEWRLMHFLKEGREFDLCYIDSLHEWSCTAASFCAAAKLLRSGGWLVMDDVFYSYASFPKGVYGWVDAMPEDQKNEPQVGNVWNLLVKTDARFHKFHEIHKMGVCQKK